MSTRLRIAHVGPVATALPPAGSGSVEQITWSLTEGLVARGHDVTLFATGDSKTSARLHATFPHGYWHDETMWPWEFYEMLNLAAAVERAAEFDVIHYQAAYYPMSLAFTRLVRTPILQTVHHSPPDEQVASWRLYPEALFAAISRAQHDMLDGLTRVGVVYNGIDLDAFSFRAEPEDYVVFLGRFTPGKGPVEAIEVAKQAGVRLLIAAPEEAYYREAVAPLVDGDRVVYVGEVGPEERDRLLGGARALIYPVQAAEPFGLVLVEAMACGTPAVALDLGAVSEIVRNGVNGFRVASLDAMAEALPAAFALDRRTVRADVERRFGTDAMVDGYVDIYRRLVER